MISFIQRTPPTALAVLVYALIAAFALLAFGNPA
jgi:hypothetical protein